MNDMGNMRPLIVLIAVFSIVGAGCVSVEAIKKETPPVLPVVTQEAGSTSSSDPLALPLRKGETVEATSTASVKEGTTPTSPEPVSAADVTFVEDALQLQATAEADGVKLAWTPIVKGKNQGYKIVRSASDPLPWYPKSGAIAFLVDGTDAAYVDHDAQKGTAYWYRVCALMMDAPVACGNVVKIELP
jgi:hypothetical protein